MFLPTLYLRPSDVGTLFPLYQAIPWELFLFSFVLKFSNLSKRRDHKSKKQQPGVRFASGDVYLASSDRL